MDESKRTIANGETTVSRRAFGAFSVGVGLATMTAAPKAGLLLPCRWWKPT